MRERRTADLGDLGFSPEEQELLDQMERASRQQEWHVSRSFPWFAVIVGTFVLLGLVSTQNPDKWASPLPPRAAASAGQPVRSLPRERDAAQNNVRLSQIYVSRGVAFGQQGNHQRALESFNAAINLDPTNAFTFLQRGVAHANLGQYHRAREDYNRAIALNPGLMEAYHYRDALQRTLTEAEPTERPGAGGGQPMERAATERTDIPEARTTHVLLIHAVNPWTDTGIFVRSGDLLTIEAVSGVIHPCVPNTCRDARFNHWIGPQGFVNLPYTGSFPSMALIGSIADSGMFLVGASVKLAAPSQGHLHLGVNDIPMSFSDNDGRFLVHVTVSRRPR